jgi:tetracycline resistance efflux pump
LDLLVILPPIVAVLLAIWKKEVFIALIAALFCSELLLVNFDLFSGVLLTLDRVVNVFSSAGNTRVLLFSLLIGALMALIKESGGVNAFVKWVTDKGMAKSPKQVAMLPTLTGIFVFIETNMSILTAGIVSQRLFDKFKLSRARLAFIIDSTCAPVSVLILLNAWGAYILGLLEGYEFSDTAAILIKTIPLNFYAIIVLVLVFYTVLSNRTHGTLKKFEQALNDHENNRSAQQSDSERQEQLAQEQLAQEQRFPATKARYMMLPLLVLVSGMLLFMLYTGNGDIMAGSGSKSVLYATASAVLVAWLLLRIDSELKHKDLLAIAFRGMSKLLPMVLTVLLAFALGASLKALGTGVYIASLMSSSLPFWMLTSVIFLVASFISFTTGTSWGTFGIMIPIALPLASVTGIPPELLVSAVIGGGVFGDHCSPISDTTIISSLGAGCDHFDHVATQIPYALFAGIITALAYIPVSLLMVA